MPTWSTSRPDWQERILDGRSLIPDGHPIFPARAEDCLRVFTQLQLVDVLGSPTFGEVSRPWVIDFVRAVFGAYNVETGRQLVRYFLLLISKKNAKSGTAAGIGLTWLYKNWRHSAEGIILAPTVEVAENSFKPARDAVKADPELSAMFHVNESRRMITDRRPASEGGTGATLKVVAADNETVSGKKASLVIVDELWAFGERANAENMLREATGGLASRPEGAVIYLSTQSEKPPAGVFDKTLQEFRAVRDGKIEDSRTFPLIYEYPPAMVEAQAYRDPSTWHITNPNLGASVDREYLIDQCNKAELAGEASYRGFAAKHLNVEMRGALRSDGWAGAQYWERGIERGLDLYTVLERSEVVTLGIDGGGLDDLLGVAVLGREKETRRWLGWAHALVSPEGLERKKANLSVYEDFQRDGDLTIVEHLPDDLELLVDIVEQVREAGLLGMVGVDVMGLPGIVDALAAIGITAEEKLLEGIRQGISLMGSIKAIERKLVDGTFRHSGSRMLAWCAGNARLVATPTAMRIARDESGYGKIDPLMALFNAADSMSRNPEPRRRPQYQAFFVGRPQPQTGPAG